MKSIVEADIIHIDETSIKLAGITIRIWVLQPRDGRNALFVTSEQGTRRSQRNTLGQLKRSDNMQRLVDITSYKIQRCWTHLTRGLRDIADKNPDDLNAQKALKKLQ